MENEMLMRTNITIFFEYYFLFKVYLYKNDIFLTQTLFMEQQNFTFVNYNTCFKKGIDFWQKDR